MIHSRRYLGWDHIWIFTTAYVPAAHKQNTGYIFLNKIYSPILCQQQLRLNHLKILKSFHFSLPYVNFENNLATCNLICHSVWCSTYHSPGMNRKIWAIKLLLGSFHRIHKICNCSCLKLIAKLLAQRFLLFWVCLAAVWADIKECDCH